MNILIGFQRGSFERLRENIFTVLDSLGVSGITGQMHTCHLLGFSYENPTGIDYPCLREGITGGSLAFGLASFYQTSYDTDCTWGR